MITDLRFIERDGEKVLQMRREITKVFGVGFGWSGQSEWQDVPVVNEVEGE